MQDKHQYSTYNNIMKKIEQKFGHKDIHLMPSQKKLTTRATSLRDEKAHVVQLSQEYQLRLAKALINPAKPNAALIKAANAYDKTTIYNQ